MVLIDIISWTMPLFIMRFGDGFRKKKKLSNTTPEEVILVVIVVVVNYSNENR
jgi:hypothetical protein